LTTDLDSWVGGLATLRHFLWHPYDFSARMVAIRRFGKGVALYPEGDTSDRWASTGVFPFTTGPSARLDISASIDQQLDWLVRQDPDYLCTYPSSALQLALASRRRGITLPHLEHVQTVGEVVNADARRICEEVWDAPIIDTYSAQEVGVLAHQCPEHLHYHVQAETVMLEVVDDRGDPCGAGEVGHVLVTSLTNYAMPLLRYRLGDFAEVGAACPCGRGLPVLTSILGRERNSVLVAPTGERFWPVFGAYGFPRIAPVIQHQFVQKSKERVEARLVTERPLTPAEEAGLREHIQAQLPWRFEIDFAYFDEISRNAAGKFEPFVSEVGLENSP
jgi:phenylacetate-CoA ligase